MKDRILNDTTSPIDAANGVAKLSGFILNLCESKITATSTKSEIQMKHIVFYEKFILFDTTRDTSHPTIRTHTQNKTR